ncbi:MAG: MBL fold metallo-hydrolase [Erysipelotrichaceae bacterium]|nr:MBL fold metallo-hydrolase [Erysipelotrichaceae bacterium]
METFQTIKIHDDTYIINDEQLCSVYVIVGTKKTLIIDSGMKNSSSLIEKIREISNNELILVLTHAHFDHIGHIDEFDNFYMAKDELLYLSDKNFDVSKCIFFDQQYIFDLGNKKILAKVFKGHTHGSTILFDKENHYAFTGDQFGSGCGVWMQTNEATSLKEYLNSIESFLSFCQNDFANITWNLWGGHYGQEKTSRLNRYNPLNMKMVENMAVLCKKILNNELQLIGCNAKKYNNEDSLYASYDSAEIIIRKSIIDGGNNHENI